MYVETDYSSSSFEILSNASSKLFSSYLILTSECE